MNIGKRLAKLEARRAASHPPRVVVRFIDTDGAPRQPEPEIDENTTVVTVHFVDSPQHDEPGEEHAARLAQHSLIDADNG